MMKKVGTNYQTNFTGISRKEGKNPDIQAKEEIRKGLEEKLGLYELTSTDLGVILSQIRKGSNQRLKVQKEIEEKAQKENVKVDEDLLKSLGHSYGYKKIPNLLYSGATLSSVKNGFETAKNAGIKSVLALENDFDKEKAEKAGLNFIALRSIGNGTLNVFSIIPKRYSECLLREMIKDPEMWATQDENGNIKENASKKMCDMQEYLDILSGKDERYPYPMYYGCQWGTTRTWAWTTLHKILANEDRSKPLSPEVLEKLKNLDEELEDAYRD
ncbi:MAG: hypothetical protein E7Z91_01485 [Cyanobacteria bacterium SIG30]|nr:hypothetical protein [Cyanobacteria bacterium SIG30]